MDAKSWTGDDDRELDPEESAPCVDCGAAYDEPCDERCYCDHCMGKRARQAALWAMDVVPDDAA